MFLCFNDAQKRFVKHQDEATSRVKKHVSFDPHQTPYILSHVGFSSPGVGTSFCKSLNLDLTLVQCR